MNKEVISEARVSTPYHRIVSRFESGKCNIATEMQPPMHGIVSKEKVFLLKPRNQAHSENQTGHERLKRSSTRLIKLVMRI